MSLDTKNGIKVYTPLSLKLYDWWVLNLSNRYAWRCHTQKYLLPHFSNNIGENHLDIGVGTGFYPKKAADRIRQISFADLNHHSLSYAKKCLEPHKIRDCIQQDIFKPFPQRMENHFDSISLFYVLHCLPGTMTDKKAAIGNIVPVLKNDGVLYGATILGNGVTHNAFGSKLMKIYNKKGIFNNYHDMMDGLESVLASFFEQVEIRLEGAVAIFRARGKKIG
ncbi:SAM-dependent methyltransferase [Chelonobacter oris]|uniref:class I SAM-dependent methyltransferase n=1 Tax=Chelonobacter oris TaxID=505317 RepID=UPI00244C5DF4|nr:class I SAM-dependent methyltransferase [Chelonobacter oris]MDH3000013.1 SAM-dependent methyltransferase [Chelonobacter oris]